MNASQGEVPGECRWGTSLAHMTRVATEAKTRDTREWIASHVRPGRRYRPPKEKGLRRERLRRKGKSLAGRYYQLLSGHAAIGTCLYDKIKKADKSEWWRNSGEPQLHHHLFVRCKAWTPQIRRL